MEDWGRVLGSPDFGTLLRHYRLAAGLSQEALAERGRMSTQGISALERGYRRTPQRETLALLVGALALNDEQRGEFQATAARSALRGPWVRVAVGPWSDGATANLPLALTSFVGREAELGEIAALLGDHRMVTLTGAGGVGKTQTALRAATALSDATHGAVCFVGLASPANPSLVVPAIGSALGVQEVPNRPLLDTLLAYLKNKSLLLIFDNCEHVITEAATVAGALLAACPNIRILATSREPLRAAGEHVYRLPSLPVPSAQVTRTLSAADAVEYGAIVLFTNRAQAAESHFAITDGTAPTVADLCRRLDGIPLAIELAAARVNVLPLNEIVEKLTDRFQILTGGERTALPRQQTMRATIDWSYDLLSAPAQKLFERLSVFAGGCTLAAATDVCTGDDVSKDNVLDLLSSLVNKSLVVSDPRANESRYYLLESFRQYAREKLRARGEQKHIAYRHALAFLKLAEELSAAYDTEADFAWTERMRPELNNWRAALEWSLAKRHDVALGQRLVGELSVVWSVVSAAEARRWTSLALGLVEEGTAALALAKIHYLDAIIAGNFDENERQLACGAKALALYRDLGDEFMIALSQAQSCRALVRLGRSKEAEPTVCEAVARMRRLGAGKHLGYVLRIMAMVYSFNGDFAAARSYIAEAIAIYEDIGALQRSAAAAGTDLAEVELNAGNPELALRLALDALPTLRAFDEVTEIADALNTISACFISLARYEDATVHARESLGFSRERYSSAHATRALHRLAAIAALRPQNARECSQVYARAARRFGFVNARFANLGSPRQLMDQREYERALAVLRSAIRFDELASFTKAGEAMSEEQAIDEALAEPI
ncbi:MAG: helix-turn-helix domain-containing protein [Candidatus Cybelea sp.]